MPPGEARDKAITVTLRKGEELAAASPQDPVVQTDLAKGALILGKPELAASRADAAVKAAVEQKAPPEELLAATRTRAVARWHTGDYPGAVADAENVLKALPKDPVAAAVSKLSADRVPGQFKLPEAPNAQTNLPELAALISRTGGGAPQPPADVKQAAELLAKGEAAMAAERYAEMHRYATQSLAVAPDNPKAYMQRAFANLFLKRMPGVLADSTLGLALEPDSAELLGLRARGYNELANYGAAFADADRAISLDSRHAMAWMERARAREGQRQPAQAWLEDFKRAAELQPAWSNLYDQALARSQAQQGGKIAGATGGASLWTAVKVGLTGLLVVAICAFFFVSLFRLRPESPPSAGPSPVPPPASPSEAPRGERYAVGRLLGQGGMGKVLEAHDTLLNRPVAIKQMREELRSNPEDLRRFIDEARTVASLAHPNIVAIHDIVESGPWLVFELVRGQTLQQAIDSSPARRLDAATTKRVVEQVCSALDHAHERKVVHRDLKPSNIMMNDGHGAKVMDFGISRVAKDSLMKTTATVAGTPLYMAPEQEEGKSQRETDLYSLGICAYEMLTGFMPFEGPAQLDRKRQGRVTATGISTDLDEFFRQALDPDAARRFHSGREFLAAFERAVSA